MKKSPNWKNNLLLLYDGECAFCQYSVKFVNKRDAKGKVYFASLQSDLGKTQLSKFGLPLDWTDSLVLIDKEEAHTHSTAALRLTGQLNFPWNALSVLLFIPKKLRDPVYNLIANNRFVLSKMQNTCEVPSRQLKSRILDY